ncbi:hypothetical protein SB717_35210, partial [Priestia sp. SIMBA_032]
MKNDLAGSAVSPIGSGYDCENSKAGDDAPHLSLNDVSRVRTELYIDGAWCSASTGDRFDVINPATEKVIASVADGGTEDAL